MTNTLYYGDNLTILREYIADESVDISPMTFAFSKAGRFTPEAKQPSLGLE